MKKINFNISVLVFCLLLSGCVALKEHQVKLEELNTSEKKISDLEKRNSDYITAYKNLMEEKNKISDENKQLQIQVDSIKNDASKIQGDRNKLMAVIKASKSEKEQMTTILEKRNSEKDKKILDLLKSLNEKEQRITELKATNQDLALNTEKQLEENNVLKNENVDYQSKIDLFRKEKEEEIVHIKTNQDKLLSELKSELKEGKIKITRLKDKLTVNILDKIIFGAGKTSVTKKGKEILAQLGAALKKVENRHIRVEGHTDNRPIGPQLKNKYPSNWELSVSRAINVARYLIEEEGIDPGIVSVVGYADTRPMVSNDTVEGRMKNRRIEIVLIPIGTE